MKEFLDRVGDLSGMLLRLVEEERAGATAPEQLARFKALLHDAKATVKVGSRSTAGLLAWYYFLAGILGCDKNSRIVRVWAQS